VKDPILPVAIIIFFQDMAPEKWTPQPHLQKLVEQNLKDDPTLKEEAKRWTKTRG
jgi:hypothetical protein